MLNYLSQADLELYQSHGYLCLKNIYTEDDVNKARQLIETYANEGKWNTAPFANDGITTDIYDRIPGLAEIVFNDKYLLAMKDLFGPEAVVIIEPAIHRNRYYYWHKDSTFLDEQQESFHWNPDFRASMTVMYLQENSPDYGGGITVKAQTQHSLDRFGKIKDMNLFQRAILKARKLLKISFYDQLDRHPDTIDVPSQKGDVVVLHLRVDHKGTSPKTKETIPYNKYGIMNLVCTGYHTADQISSCLRKRPPGYYQDYLSKKVKLTKKLDQIAKTYKIKMQY